MKWLKVKVLTDRAAEELIAGILMEAGAQGVAVEGSASEMAVDWPAPDEYVDEQVLVDRDFSVSAYFAGGAEDALSDIRERLDGLNGQGVGVALGSLEIVTEEVDEDDWANAWKAYFKPVKLSDTIVVKPTWEEYAPDRDEIVIEIDPGMAFGTGTHETTRMCVKLLEEYMEPGARVIDVGTGSGILSAAAIALGAGEVYALDFDEVAVEAAAKNIEFNGGGERARVMKSDLLSALDADVKADIVVANIIADIIIRLAPEVVNHVARNATFICSGIIDSRLEDVEASLKQNGFRPVKILEDGEWRAVACIYKG